MKTKTICLLLSAVFLATTPVLAQTVKKSTTGTTKGASNAKNGPDKSIYRWVDDKGTVTYADRITPGFNLEFVEYNPRSWIKKAPANADSATTDELEKLIEEGTPQNGNEGNKPLITNSMNKVEDLDKAYKDEMTNFEKSIAENKDAIKQMKGEKERLEGLLRTVDNPSEYGRIRESIDKLDEAMAKSEKVMTENEKTIANREKQYKEARDKLANQSNKPVNKN